MQKIEFRDVDEFNCIISVPVLEQESGLCLRMWVAYDRGRRYSLYDYSEVKRGYYLYLSFEEAYEDCLARGLSSDTRNSRVFLGEVKRKSEGWTRDFSRLAEKIILRVIADLYPKMKLDWEEMKTFYWSGKGSGVGMFCDFYKVIPPKEEWL